MKEEKDLEFTCKSPHRKRVWKGRFFKTKRGQHKKTFMELKCLRTGETFVAPVGLDKKGNSFHIAEWERVKPPEPLNPPKIPDKRAERLVTDTMFR